MANYSAIKAAVNAYIKANGRKEITGSILNAVLNATIDSLGKYFQFAGVATPTTDPENPDQNVCYLAGEPGTYTNFDNIVLENDEIALLFFDGTWSKQRMLLGIQEVIATVDDTVGTPSVDVAYSEGQLELDFHNIKGDKGDTGNAAGFGTIGATIDGNIGTPGVSVQESGPATAKNLVFNFTNLKGETGVTSVVATIDNATGTPSCEVSLVGQQLTFAFHNLKGAQGNTGSSVDYPYELVNNLTTDDATKGLTAAQGKVLDGKVSQLEAKVGNFAGRLNLPYGTPIGSRYVYWSNGTLTQSGVCSAITDVDVSAYVGKTLYYSRARIPAAQGNQGMAFMKADGTFLSGVQGILNESVWGIELSSITIPSGAAKARFTCPTTELSNFQCYVEQSIGEKVTMLDQRQTASETDIANLQAEVTQKFGIPVNLNAAGVVAVSVKAGQKYYVFNAGQVAVNTSTRLRADGDPTDYIDGLFSVPAGGSTSFTASADANYFRFSDAFSGYIIRESELYKLVTAYDDEISALNEEIDQTRSDLDVKIDGRVASKPGKNLFDKDSPLLIDNSVFDQDGNVSTNQYTIYWLISNPIDVSGHQGGKIICNKSYDIANRYCLFVDAEGNKTTIPASVAAYTIPANAVTAYILVYKQGGSVNLNEVQIEFGEASSEYVPYNPIGGYFSEEGRDDTVFPPSPQKDMHETYPSINTAYIYGVFDSWVAKFPTYVVKTNLGRDASNQFDVNGYKISFATNPLFKIMFICNQHGGSANGDPVMGAYIATQFINDICGSGHRHNDRLKWIRNNVEIYIIPAANPWGIDNKRRVNYNGVNLNRNWPTSGWASEPSGQGTDDYKGAAAADQPELQHYLQYISDVNPDIIIDNHTLGGMDGSADANSGYMFIGFITDTLENNGGYNAMISTLRTLMQREYGITPSHYGSSSDTTPDCRVWCGENGFWGGLIEMQWRDPLDGDAGFTPNIIEASYMLCLSLYQYYANVDLS